MLHVAQVEERVPGPPLIKWELSLTEMPLRKEEADGAYRVPGLGCFDHHPPMDRGGMPHPAPPLPATQSIWIGLQFGECIRQLF